ncbi:hypothetical protein [Kosakonia radicincitans]|uniref:hypothetical protein n=1 Tax=Kosakonia radicincitans TaxID=283686 RepID=UPI0031DE2D33
MANLAIVQEKVRSFKVSNKDSLLEELITLAGVLFFDKKIYSVKREYFFEISYTTGELEEVTYRSTLADSTGEREKLEPGTADNRNDKLVAIAHDLTMKGFNIDEAQLALLLNGKIQRLICKKY